MEGLDPKTPDTGAQPAASFQEWWSALSPEDRYQAMECVRLDEAVGLADIETRHPAPDALVTRGGPSTALADFVRRRREYLERYTLADSTARKDDIPVGRSNVPDAHARTAPIVTDEETGEESEVVARD